jgi:chaperonin cofactor prefoldin
MARALLTDAERRALYDEDMDQNNRSTNRNRIEKKLGRLGEDARIMREHAPELYERARAEFCEADLDERIERLENEVEELRDQLDGEDQDT